jgi:PAS domain S-box-containing protein
MKNRKRNLASTVSPSAVTQADSGAFNQNPIFIMDTDGTILELNASFASRFGMTIAECQGVNIYDLLESAGLHDLVARRRKAGEEGILTGREVTFDEIRNGRYERHTVCPIGSSDSGITKLIVCIQDITELKQTLNELNKELAEKNIRFRQALEAASAGVWEWNTITGENLWSDELWALYGLRRGNAQPSYDLWVSSIHPDDREMATGCVLRAFREETDLNCEYRVYHLDGSIHWLMSRGKPERDEHGRIVRFIGTVIDITDRQRMALELQQNQTRWDSILSQWHIGLWEHDLQNHTATRTLEQARIFGYNSVDIKWSIDTFLGHVYVEDRPAVAQILKGAIAEQNDYVVECRIVRTDGEMRWINSTGKIKKDESGNVIGLQGIIQDITERKEADVERQRLESQLQQSQKMEMLGQLAGGIAHDFNNVMAAILGNAELMIRKIDDRHPFYDNLDSIRQSVNHSTEMVRRLLAFARRQVWSPKIIELDEELLKIQSMLSTLIRWDIRLQLDLKSGHALVSLDPTHLVQIITNLCINSRDSIAGSGVITIATRTLKGRECNRCSASEFRVPGECVMISFSDTGSGIEQDVLPHIFEPFFSTKGLASASGLGLSMVYGIIKQNGGFIECQSEVGVGTTFNICFPKCEVPRSESEIPQDIPPDHLDKETVLIVEDEPNILQIIKDILESQGHTVFTAGNAEEAISIADQHGNQLDLLISDIVLPEMNGFQLGKLLQASKPDLKILFMSGYTTDVIGQREMTESGTGFILKPFTINDFLVAVRAVLTGASKKVS